MNGFELILPFLRPIQHLILDPDISEIMVNGPERIFIEKAGYLRAVPDVRLTPESLIVAVKNIARRLGDDISEAKPILDSRLPDGSRVAAVIPPCSIERIVLIEDTAEIQIQKPNVLRFEARREQNGLAAVTIRDLLKATLRHRPDRIILGEIRGGEAFDLLQLLNTGHSGTISTVHANSAAQGISRFTTCVLQSGIEIPYMAIKTNIAESLDVVVHIERRPGQRRVAEVLALRRFDSDLDKYNFDFVYQYRAES